jgi:cullin 3
LRSSSELTTSPLQPTEPVDATLDHLKDAIKQIQQHNVSQLSFEEHYRYAYNLVLHKKVCPLSARAGRR